VLSPGSIGYVIAALGYAALFFLLLVAWQGRGSGWRLVAAALVTAVWAAALAQFDGGRSASTAPAVLLDAGRYLAWLAVLANGAAVSTATSRIAGVARLSCLAVACLALAATVLGHAMASELAVASALLMPAIGLWFLLRLNADTAHGPRSWFVYLGVGVGSVMVCDVVLYTQTVLPGGSTAETWLVRGYVACLAIPFIALAVTRGSPWPFRFTVSRDAAFYTTLATAVGGYALLASIGGHLLRLVGGSQGAILQWSFYSVAFALLVALVASTRFRRWLRVSLVKNFFEHKYEYREEWLRFIATLSDTAAGEDSRSTGLRAIAQIIMSPGAILLWKDEGGRLFRIAATWPGDETFPGDAGDLGRSVRLIELLERREWVVDIADQRHDRRPRDSLDLPAGLVADRRWRLIVPVLFKSTLRGMVLLQDPHSDFALTFEDRDLLKTVSRHVATHLAQHEAEQRLAEVRQFEAYSRLAAFLMHDLKNAAAQLQLVVANAGRHKHNPEFIDDAIDTVSNAASRISRLIDQLGRGSWNESDGPVSVEHVAASAIERTLDREPRPSLKVEASGLCVDMGREQIGNIIEHLIRNAQDATPADGKIEVVIRQETDMAIICISDTGHGMEPAFVRNRLFKPFDSTKGSKGMGIGAYQAREFARSRGGDMLVESAQGRGTTVHMSLPVAKISAVA
jgi:putative PEP-CTERM system histidine kinase